MGYVDSLQQALVKRLPPTSTREAVRLALLAAVELLPPDKVKAREQIRKTSERCVTSILEELHKLKQAQEESDFESEAEPAKVEPDNGSDADDQTASDDENILPSAYAGVDTEDHLACIRHCSMLLTDSFRYLRAHVKTAEAIDGLLGLLPNDVIDNDSDGSLSLEACEKMASIVPLASAGLSEAVDGQYALHWRRLLASVLLSPCRLADDVPEATAQSLARRFSGLVSLLVSPAAARGTIRLAFGGFERTSVPTGRKLSLLATAVLPLVGVAFGSSMAEAISSRSDLAPLLHLCRLVSLCRSSKIEGAVIALEPLGESLKAMLAASFNAQPLVPQLRTLAEDVKSQRAKTLKKRLQTGGSAEKSRESASAALYEVLSIAATTLEPSSIDRMVEISGLPRAIEDEVNALDARAALAKARGDLFFEDAAGHETKKSKQNAMENAGVSEGTRESATAAISERVYESIDDLETLKDAARVAEHADPTAEGEIAEEIDEVLASTSKKALKRRSSEALSVAGSECDAEGAPTEPSDVKQEPSIGEEPSSAGSQRRVRRRRKSAPDGF